MMLCLFIVGLALGVVVLASRLHEARAQLAQALREKGYFEREVHYLGQFINSYLADWPDE